MRFGGANPERTTCGSPSRPKTHEQERAGQPARDDTSHQPPTARGRVRVLPATLDEDEDDRLGEHGGVWCAVRVEGVVVMMAL